MNLSSELSFDALKIRHREVRDGLPDAVSLRTHRACWLARSEQEKDDKDAQFIFL